jgi:hypothetical protein
MNFLLRRKEELSERKETKIGDAIAKTERRKTRGQSRHSEDTGPETPHSDQKRQF